MTTTSTFTGIQEDAKTSSRVLKPPGGGSSNIFGPGESAAARPSIGACKTMESGVFKAGNTSMKGSAQRSARDGDDSFSRLFGNVMSSPARKQKCYSATQRVDTHANLFGESASLPFPSFPSDAESTHQHIFGERDEMGGGESHTGRYLLKGRGSFNPITGTDYKDLAPNHHALHVKELPKPQKEQPPLPCSDGEYQAKPGKMQNVQTSTRISNPPGGKTHKLW